MKKKFITVPIILFSILFSNISNAKNNSHQPDHTPKKENHYNNQEKHKFNQQSRYQNNRHNNYNYNRMPPPPPYFVYAEGDYGPNYYSGPRPQFSFYNNTPDGFMLGKFLTNKDYEVDWKDFPQLHLSSPPVNHKWVKVDNVVLLVDVLNNVVIRSININ